MKKIKVDNLTNITTIFDNEDTLAVAVVNAQILTILQTLPEYRFTLIREIIKEDELYIGGRFKDYDIFVDPTLAWNDNIITFLEDIDEYGIDNDHVSFEIAKQLKEKGYPQLIDMYEWYFNIDGKLCQRTSINIPPIEERIKYPTLGQVQFWFWVEKKMYIEIIAIDLSSFIYRIVTEEYDNFEEEYTTHRITSKVGEYTTPKQALSAGIIKALTLI